MRPFVLIAALICCLCQAAHAKVENYSLFNGEYTYGLTAGSILFDNGTALSQNNANLFWDNTNLRLGLGTNSPTYPLQVVGTMNGPEAVVVQNNSSATSATATFEAISSTGVIAGLQVFSNSFTLPTLANKSVLFGGVNGLITLSNNQVSSGGTDTFQVITGGYSDSPTMVVTAGSPGQVGIGTSSPSYSLDVTGTVRATSSITDNGIPASAAGAPLSITSGQVLTYGVTNSEVNSSSNLSVSTTLGVLGGATATPAAGTYLVVFSAYASAASAGGNVLTAEFYVGGTGQADTIRKITPFSSAALGTFQNMSFSINKLVTVNGSQAIAVEASTSAGTVTVSGLDFDIVRVQ